MYRRSRQYMYAIRVRHNEHKYTNSSSSSPLVYTFYYYYIQPMCCYENKLIFSFLIFCANGAQYLFLYNSSSETGNELIVVYDVCGSRTDRVSSLYGSTLTLDFRSLTKLSSNSVTAYTLHTLHQCLLRCYYPLWSLSRVYVAVSLAERSTLYMYMYTRFVRSHKHLLFACVQRQTYKCHSSSENSVDTVKLDRIHSTAIRYIVHINSFRKRRGCACKENKIASTIKTIDIFSTVFVVHSRSLLCRQRIEYISFCDKRAKLRLLKR